jgi:protein arginine kinase activator
MSEAAKCQKCGQRPAKIRYTEVREGEALKLWLCEECAETLGFEVHGPAGSAQEEQSTAEPGLQPEPTKIKPKVVVGPGAGRCPACGLTPGEFRRLSRFGCPHCYESFGRALESILKRIHGATRHRGRLPGGREAEFCDPAELRRELAEAIRNEDFEAAARLRDRLSRLARSEAAPENPAEEDES